MYLKEGVYDYVRKGASVPDSINPLARNVHWLAPDSIISPEDAYDIYLNWPTPPNIRYFSSEMGPFEVHHRLKKWGADSLPRWPRSQNPPAKDTISLAASVPWPRLPCQRPPWARFDRQPPNAPSSAMDLL